MKLDNELKERTIDNKVKESALTLQNLMAEILLKGSQQKVNEEQAKAIPAEILQGWEKLVKEGKAIINQREQMEAYAQDVINKYGQQIGLLAYEQAAKDNEEVGIAYELKFQQLKNLLSNVSKS